MERRERVLAALNLEVPDQVPTHVIYLDANNVDKIMGTPDQTDFETLAELQKEYPDDWIDQLNQTVEQLEVSIFSRMVESVFEIGIDTTQVGIVPVDFISEDEMKDIFGRIWIPLNNEGNINPYYKHGTIDSLEKWELIKQDIEDRATEKYCKMAKKFYRRINKKFKDTRSKSNNYSKKKGCT